MQKEIPKYFIMRNANNLFCESFDITFMKNEKNYQKIIKFFFSP